MPKHLRNRILGFEKSSQGAQEANLFSPCSQWAQGGGYLFIDHLLDFAWPLHFHRAESS